MDKIKPPLSGPDVPLRLAFSWSGNPSTKKNSPQIFWFKAKGPRPAKPSKAWPWTPRIHPSQRYMSALKGALVELGPQVRKFGVVPPKTPVNVEAHFILGARQCPDIDGLKSACGDILQAAGIVPNDYWISTWEGTQRHRDIKKPRTVAIITSAAANFFEIPLYIEEL